MEVLRRCGDKDWLVVDCLCPVCVAGRVKAGRIKAPAVDLRLEMTRSKRCK